MNIAGSTSNTFKYQFSDTVIQQDKTASLLTTFSPTDNIEITIKEKISRILYFKMLLFLLSILEEEKS